MLNLFVAAFLFLTPCKTIWLHDLDAAKETAKKEGERLILVAKAQIEQEKQQAKDSLRKEVSALALRAAEQILSAEIDKTKHQDILSKISNQLG